MPDEPLPKDPDSLEKWKQLPQETPPRQALPLVAGGLPRWSKGWLIVLAVLIILALLTQARPG